MDARLVKQNMVNKKSKKDILQALLLLLHMEQKPP
jgi:hypothetical protein